MEYDYGPDDLDFRDELRSWLKTALDPSIDADEWHRRLVEDRWVVPSWPTEWGGREASLAQQVIYTEEMAEADAPPPNNSLALHNIGPMLLVHGTRAQQERYLPPMVRAEEIWCQGFSEPEAGSDLASLRTRAEDGGDHWVVSGQKTWNTLGDRADRCLALCRTDPSAPKHRGISALIIDMHHPGVEVRPLRDMTGNEGFNDIFFNEVAVPKDDVIGDIHGGWKVAMTTLVYERVGTMNLGIQARKRLDRVIELARMTGRDHHPGTRERVTALGIEVEMMRLLTWRALEALLAGRDPGAMLPLGKLQWAYLMQELAELAIEIEGPHGGLYRGSFAEMPGDWAYHCLYSRMTTIGAGTTQVQKNIIAQRVLGLPRGF